MKVLCKPGLTEARLLPSAVGSVMEPPRPWGVWTDRDPEEMAWPGRETAQAQQRGSRRAVWEELSSAGKVQWQANFRGNECP